MNIFWVVPIAAVLIASAESPEQDPPAKQESKPDPRPADVAGVAGRVKIKGEMPKRRKISTNADPKCSALHGDSVLLSDDFVIDPTGGVQWAVVYVKEGL